MTNYKAKVWQHLQSVADNADDQGSIVVKRKQWRTPAFHLYRRMKDGSLVWLMTLHEWYSPDVAEWPLAAELLGIFDDI